MQFGSTSPLLGNDGVAALNEAIARRQTGDVSAMAQVGTNSPIAQPMPQAPTGQSMPPTGQPMPQAPALMGQPLPQGQSDAEIILSALSARLKSDSKIKEAQAIPQVPKF